jgi:uncharacterized protein (DUF2147 family)
MFTRKNLLGFNTNAKTVKGEKIGYYTGILYLAPANISGFQVCPMAKAAGCEKACLYSAGRGAFNSIQQARIAKTQYYFNNRSEFMLNIVKDIEKGQRKAAKLGQQLLIRLNGTSDIRWENVSFTDSDGKHYDNIMSRFPNVQFYDYTKDVNRKDLPANYDLTFSYSGVDTFKQYANKAMAKGMRIAAVFRYERDIPNTFNGLPVISGDNSDVRHIEPKAHIVALYAKGKAVKDNSGFVLG